MGKKLSAEVFLQRCLGVHGNKYCYTVTKYQDMCHKVDIECMIHGIFSQNPTDHLAGKGCPKCKANVLRNKFILSTQQFITKAQQVHGELYDYSKSNYQGARTKIEISCKQHGSFWQLPTNHISKHHGCPKCNGGVKSTQEDFFVKANKRFQNKFDYQNVIYHNASTKVEIICHQHGVFYQTPNQHLLAIYGCPRCWLESFDHGISKASRKWLESLQINDLVYEKEIWIQYKKLIVDGYSLQTNTVYEYLGVFWHGHPDYYQPDKLHPIQKIPFRDLYEATLERLQLLRSAGYTVVYCWG